MAFLVKGTNIVGGKIEEGGASALADLTDVQLTTPTNGQALVYDSELQKFINADGGSANIPEYTYSYWLAHRAELEATGKPFIVTNAPPSPDLTAENIAYDNTESGVVSDNVQAALDNLFGNAKIIDYTSQTSMLVAGGTPPVFKVLKVGRIVFIDFISPSVNLTPSGIIALSLPNACIPLSWFNINLPYNDPANVSATRLQARIQNRDVTVYSNANTNQRISIHTAYISAT